MASGKRKGKGKKRVLSSDEENNCSSDNNSDSGNQSLSSALNRIRAQQAKSKSSSKLSISSLQAADKEANTGLKRVGQRQKKKVKIEEKEELAVSSAGSSSDDREPFRTPWLAILPDGIQEQEHAPFFMLEGCDAKGTIQFSDTLLEQLRAYGLAVFNNTDGYVISKHATSSEVMDLVIKNLPIPYRWCRVNTTIFNPFNSIFREDSGQKFVLPIHLCIRQGRRITLAPGVEGIFPTGEYIKRVCKSKTKGSWLNNVLVFASYKSIPEDFLTAWSKGEDPCPFPSSQSWSFPSSKDGAEDEDGKDAWEEEDEEEVSEIACVNDEGEEDSDFDRDLNEALRRSQLENSRTTRSMSRAGDPGPSSSTAITISNSPHRGHPSALITGLTQQFSSSKSNAFSGTQTFAFGK